MNWFHIHYCSSPLFTIHFWQNHGRRRIVLGKTIAGLTVATPLIALAQGAYLLYGTCVRACVLVRESG
jgi:hypothetical protein